MRVPVSWLAEYIALDRDVKALAEGLTAAGLKVEAIHRPGVGIAGVVVGEVRSVEPHPAADKLVLVDVALGDGVRRVVCGARNFATGDRVPVAPPGARLPEGREVERMTIRGVASDGMLCSARELGVGDDTSGILLLPPEAEVGADVTEALGLDEAVLDIEVTPNRPDAMSMLGIAREVAAFTGAELRPPEVSLEEGPDAAQDLAEVRVDDAAACPRYLARVITGVTFRGSPAWAQRRLSAAGIRPISALVDATNYALIVTGHPMHAFDLDLLQGHRIVVRRASAGESLTTIDGARRALDPDDLVIADAGRPVALAGIMGGIETEVSEQTGRVLLESAHFDPASVLRTSKRHALRSEASARFERGTDPNQVSSAADLACSLILEWSGGELAAGAIDRYPAPMSPRVVTLRPERVRILLGRQLGLDEMSEALSRIGLESTVADGRIRVTVPTRRPDITAEEDLIEEVARLTGYDMIPSTLPPGRSRAGGLTRQQRLVREVRRLLAGAGVSEAYTSSLIGPADLDRIGYGKGHPARATLRLANPLVKDESYLRTSLVPGLLAAASRNVARRTLLVRLYEIGRCFHPQEGLLPRESERLGIVLHGPVPQQWHTPAREIDVFDLKGVLEDLLVGLAIEGASFRPEVIDVLHPARAGLIEASGRTLGFFGELSPEACSRYDMSHRAYVAELDLQMVLDIAGPPTIVGEIPRFPAVLLDLAVELPDEVPASDVVETAGSAGGEILEEVRIFDVYAGAQVGEGHKSLALSLCFRRPDRTLAQQEALAARDAIVEAIAERHGGRVRD